MQLMFPPQQVHGKQQAHQTKVMITVQVTDKNVIDAMVGDLVTHELHLRPFTTINEDVPVLYVEILRRRKSAVGRKCSTGAEDGYCE